MVRIKRIYETPEKVDGFRILVDRLWPRGMDREKAGLDLWLKEVAPSLELRVWFNHEPTKFSEFRSKYIEELKGNSAARQLQELAEKYSNLTLLYAAKDTKTNHAFVLQKFLEE